MCEPDRSRDLQYRAASLQGHRDTEFALHTMERDRNVDVGRRSQPARVERVAVDRADSDQRQRIALGFQRLFEHVVPRRLDRLRRGRRVEARRLAQSRFVDGEPIEANGQIGLATAWPDVAANVVARDDVIVTEARERARPPHLDRDDRGGGIDGVHGLATRRRASIHLLGKRVRRRSPARRDLCDPRSATGEQYAADDGRQQRASHCPAACSISSASA